ncbi:MAG: hypothetical protein IH840_12385, partial [Candidatus Heimdallarchaeota archaeon]|nr:hypothetical protein [Candidatus Heimdallarchaeota archaeon]
DGNSALDEVSVEVVSDIGATSEDPPSLPLSFSGIFLALLFTLVIVRSNHRNKYDQR